MASDETQRVLNLFGVAVTNPEDAIDRRAPVDEITWWDQEVADRTREMIRIPRSSPAVASSDASARRCLGRRGRPGAAAEAHRLADPDTTEILCLLGLGDALVGITVYCVEPRDVVRGKTRIGGEKDPDLAKIRALEPDLVVANVEENRREDIDQLRAWSIPGLGHVPADRRPTASGSSASWARGRRAEPAPGRCWRSSSRCMRVSSARRGGARRWRSSTRSGADRT